MEKKFFQHKSLAIIDIVSIILAFIAYTTLIIVYINMLKNNNPNAKTILTIMIIGVVLIFLSISTANCKHNLDRIIISPDGITSINKFNKTFIDWDDVTGFNIVHLKSMSANGLYSVPKLVLHYNSIHKPFYKKIYMDPRCEIINAISQYYEIYGMYEFDEVDNDIIQ